MARWAAGERPGLPDHFSAVPHTIPVSPPTSSLPMDDAERISFGAGHPELAFAGSAERMERLIRTARRPFDSERTEPCACIQPRVVQMVAGRFRGRWIRARALPGRMSGRTSGPAVPRHIDGRSDRTRTPDRRLGPAEWRAPSDRSSRRRTTSPRTPQTPSAAWHGKRMGTGIARLTFQLGCACPIPPAPAADSEDGQEAAPIS